MERKFLVVGDPPLPGGRILEYQGPSFSVLGHRAALIGGRAYCEGCSSIGIITKAGGPRRLKFISEVALEGDVVMCRCPTPQPLISRLQENARYDDGAALDSPMQPVAASAPAQNKIIAYKETVDAAVIHAPSAEITESFCPNMTNKEFCSLMLRLRDKAVDLISSKRLPELDRWDQQARQRVQEWFGVADEATRQHLRQGFQACVRILRELTCDNFVRYSDISNRTLACTFPNEVQSGTVAAVCKPDTVTHTLAFTIEYCELREFSSESDSKLLTLIHEVTHFDDCFGSTDAIYKMKEARKAVRVDRATLLRSNADSLAGYVLWGEPYAD